MPELHPQCPSCCAPLEDGMLNPSTPVPCPACKTPVQVEIFPAWFRPPAASSAGERVVLEGEASCFYHAEKKAVQPCEGCGRFLCGLCDCELQGRHFCPVCIELGQRKGKIKNLQNERTRYDKIALGLALLPIVTVYFTAITAPLAIFIAIRHWNTPLSVIPQSRWRFVLAIIASFLQIAGWAVAAYFIIREIRSHG